MARTPRRPGRGWYPRPELLVAVVIAAALLFVAGAVVRARGSGGTPAADQVRIIAGTPTAAATGPRAGAEPSPPSPSPAATVATATPAATPVPTATPTPTPSPTPTPEPPSVTLRPTQVGNGTTLFVSVTGPASDTGSVTFDGHSFPLSRDGDELWAVLGVPIDEPAGPGTLTVELRDAAGAASTTVTAPYQVVHVDRPVDNLTLTTQEASILTVAAGQKETQLRVQQFSRFDRGRRWTGRFLWPVTGPITTYFGQGRRINGGPPGDFHSGTDIAADEGTPVVAAAPGRVSWTGEMPIRGNTIVIDHGAGVMTSYSHLSAIDVSVDDEVAAGDVIGKVGHTGLATGPHLHWELLIYGTDVDAIEWTKTDFAPSAVGPPSAGETPGATPTPTPPTTPTAETPSATATPTPSPTGSPSSP